MTEIKATHKPVLLQESIEQLAIKPAGLYIDGTFGRGGHSQAILQLLDGAGRLIAFDKDPAAIKHAGEVITDKRFSIVHASFADIKDVLAAQGLLGQVDGILLDLGVSSPQLDEAERGFSFMRDGPLDMRMNTEAGSSAADWLKFVKEEDLANVIFEYGEERFSRRIAKAIVEARKLEPITTTKQLAELVATAVPRREPGKHPATRSFQAIRIFVNKELDDLSVGLTQCVEVLKIGGRLAVISFHSLEDRIVKQFMKQQSSPPKMPRHLPIKHADFHPELKVLGKPIFPGDEELRVNIRARSAVLRTVEKQ